VKLPALTTVLFGAAIGLIFFYAPTDADQGFSQRIFYFHVPIALTSYACFGWGATSAPTSRATSRSTRASSSAR
jgi:heme exporter protein C